MGTDGNCNFVLDTSVGLIWDEVSGKCGGSIAGFSGGTILGEYDIKI